MNILISNNDFSYLSGSPLSCYELARELKNFGHNVIIVSRHIGGIITQKANEIGIPVYSFDNIPPFKPDILHLNQSVSKEILDRFDIPSIYTIHSEFECETPLIDERIKKYICIRPSIQEHAIREHGIDINKTEVIYNPVDFSRFNKEGIKDEGYVLFVGTVDPMRRKTIDYLIANSDKKVLIVGKKFDNYLDNINSQVEWRDEKWDIEIETKNCSETAGIMLGRSTIEGWACGKNGTIYEIDQSYNIKEIKYIKASEVNLDEFDSKKVVKKIESIYISTIADYSGYNL